MVIRLLSANLLLASCAGGAVAAESGDGLAIGKG